MNDISDDELIQAMCIEDSKQAWAMIFDRHAAYINHFILSWLSAHYLWRRTTQDIQSAKLANTIVTGIFNRLWHHRKILLYEINVNRFRIFKVEPTDKNKILGVWMKHASLRQYLVNQARRKVYSISRGFGKQVARKSS